MIRFSASKASLLTKCKYPFRADVETGLHGGGATRASEEARCGSALHRAAEWEINYGPGEGNLVKAAAEFGVESQLARLIRQWGPMREWITRARNTLSLVAEPKFALALDRREGRRLQASADRDYSEAQPDEIPMTIDLIGMRQGVVPFFRDWKTGWTAEGYWPQIAVNALAFAYWLQAAHPDVWAEHQAVEGGILHVTGEGVDDSRIRVFDRYDLAAIADDLRGDLAAVPSAAPTPGPHCLDLHCPAFRMCPATSESVAAVEQLVPADKLVRQPGRTLSPRIESADHAAWCKQQLRVFYAYAEEVERAVDAFVGDVEHPLTEGGVLKRTFRNVARQSVAELIALCKAHGATEEEIAGCTHMSRESAGIRVVKGASKGEKAA